MKSALFRSLVLAVAAITRILAATCRFVRSTRVRAPPSDLDRVLLNWTHTDRFTVRDLLNGGVAILGRTGSGKTTSSGRILAESIVRFPKSGGLITGAKPGDYAFWQRLFKAAGRENDLLRFGPTSALRCNFLDFASRNGSETRNIVHLIQVLGETLQSNSGSSINQEPFWRQAQERLLFFAIIVVRLANAGKVSATDLQRFITGAANTPEQLRDPKWTNSLHVQYLEAACNAPKSEVEAHDFKLAADYWYLEHPGLADRTKSSIITGVLGTLHALTTGVARTLISGETNISPEDMFRSKFIFVDMSPSEWGVSGTFVNTGLKYITQQAVLQRDAKEGDCINVIWCDEAHIFLNSFDATYLAQSRSHLGAMVFLSQGIPGYRAALGGESGENQTNSLMSNFATTIVHASDPVTAEWASQKLGRNLQSFYGGSFAPTADIYDDLFGELRLSGTVNEHYEDTLQPAVFQNGLRTGGKRNNKVCDAIVIKSGESFSNGENWLFRSFKQE